MKSRRRARECALQALYQCDTLSEWTQDSVNLYFQIFKPEVSAADVKLEAAEKDNFEFSKAIILGVIEKMDFIDGQISGASTNWSIGRMCRVDRNILRLATFEIAFVDDIPVSVSINEAIEIAKTFGTLDSPMFINGVLDKIANVLERNPDIVNGALAQAKRLVVNG